MVLKDSTLGIVTAMHGCQLNGDTWLHLSFGRVIDRLAARCRRLLLSMPLADHRAMEAHDYRLTATNIDFVPQPFYTTTLGSLRHVVPITRAYARVCRGSDVVFARGQLPYVGHFYALARWRRLRPCHWIIGNSIALVRVHPRGGRLLDAASLLYAWQDQECTRAGRWLTGGSFICNGSELAQIYDSPRTSVAVSSTITDDEFFERNDTCQGPVLRLLFVGFLRPEKGLEYLIEALTMIGADRPFELTIVGVSEQYQQHRSYLERRAAELGVADRLRWLGYAPFGPELFAHLQAADMLVLPTLSEGTPRVLIEARAQSLPIVATNVGGIPSSVTDGVDGLLVPPKDAGALAAAIKRIVSDGDLRRMLIRNGRDSARRLTVDRFVERVAHLLEE